MVAQIAELEEKFQTLKSQSDNDKSASEQSTKENETLSTKIKAIEEQLQVITKQKEQQDLKVNALKTELEKSTFEF